MNVSQRVCVYPKDVMRVTGKSERYARKLLNRIKKHLSKPSHQFVTVSEFSDYTGIDKPTIVENLVD